MRIAASLLLLLAACSKKEPDPTAEAYNSFKYRNFILGQTFPGGRTIEGSIDIDTSRDGGGASDWIEVAVNGEILGRSNGPGRVSMGARFRSGPNKVSFFSSAALKYWEFDVDQRQGTRVELAPKEKLDYDITVTKDE